MQYIDKISDFADAAPDGPGLRAALELQLMREEHEQALREVEARSAKCQESGDGPGRAAALQATATVRHVLGELAKAKTVAHEALAAFRLFGGVKGEAMVLHTLARICLDMENLDEAEQFATEAKTKFEEVSCQEGAGAASITLSKVAISKGTFEETTKAADNAETAFKGAGSKEGQAATLITKSMIRMATGEFAEASALAQEAAAMCRGSSEPASRHREADALLLMSSAALAQSSGQEGLEKAKAALAVHNALGGKRGRAIALQGVSSACLELWSLEEAIQAIDEAAALQAFDKQVQASVLSTAARVYRARLWKDGGELPDLAFADVALGKAKAAVSLYRELGYERSVAVETLEMAQMNMECGNADEALQTANTAQELFAKIGEPRGQAVSLLITSELHYNKGDNETALSHAKSGHRAFKESGAEDLASQAAEVIKFLEKQMAPKKKKSDVPPPAPEGEGGVKNTTYSQLIRHRISSPETEPLCFDMPNILYMGMILGINIPFLPDPTGQAPPATVKPRPSAKGAASAASAPASDAMKEARRRQEMRAAEAEKEEEEAPPAKLAAPPVVGSDVLGGRARDTPEELHNKMLTLAQRGDIPYTNPDKRAKHMLRKPTFHGPPEWREAVQHGYLHPTTPAPRGLKWKSLTVGWKLISQVAGSAEQMEHLAAASRSRDEPLRGAPWLACK